MQLPFDISDWKFWLIVVATLALLYFARPYLHRLLKSVFFGLSHILNRMALWLGHHGAVVYERYCETVGAHLADEYQDKLHAHELRLGTRVTKHDKEILRVIDKLETSSQEIEGSVEALGHINLPQTAVSAMRTSLSETVDAKSQARITAAVNQVKKSVSAEIQTVKPQLNVIRTHMKPMSQNVSKLKEYSQNLSQMSDRINKDFEIYEEAIHSEDRIAVAQKQSILIPWLISLIIMTIALTGVFLNFFLIERPMAEIVGDGLQIVGMSLPMAAALVVIFLEAVAGVVLMEAAGVTKLGFFHNLSDMGRRVMFWTAFAFLCAFSLFEALLAVQRESLIALDQATQAMALGLETEEGAESGGVSLTMIAQIVLAVLIPWLLAIAAVPFENVVKNFVFLVTLIWHQLLVFLAFLCKTLSTVAKSLGLFLLRLYDLIIFLPLAIEQMVRAIQGSKRQSGAAR